MSTSVTNKAARDYVRMFFAGASDETPDKQGRITVPPLLRDYASLTKDCMVIGAMNRIEIWDAGSWQTYSDQQEQAFADLSEEVFPGSLEQQLKSRRTRSHVRSHHPSGTPSPVPEGRAGGDLVRRTTAPAPEQSQCRWREARR